MSTTQLLQSTLYEILRDLPDLNPTDDEVATLADRLAERGVGNLDAAWAEAEAALPAGWWFDVFSLSLPNWWEVIAKDAIASPRAVGVQAEGVAAALQALAAKLRADR